MRIRTRFLLATRSPFHLSKLLVARLKGRRCGLAAYQINHLYLANELLSLRGKRVLEVGGSLPEALVIDHYKCKNWVGVDDRQEYERKLNWSSTINQQKLDNTNEIHKKRWTKFDGRIQDIPPLFDGQFDVVFSNAVLEHVDDLSGALGKMKAALVPGGRMYHTVGPIWSGPRGHHVFPTYFREHGVSAGQSIVSQIKPWMHLANTPDQMLEKMRATVGETLAKAAVYSIYESPRINRRLFYQYIEAFELSGFDVLWIHPWKKKTNDTSCLDALDINSKNRDNYLFDVFSVVLSKSV